MKQFFWELRWDMHEVWCELKAGHYRHAKNIIRRYVGSKKK